MLNKDVMLNKDYLYSIYGHTLVDQFTTAIKLKNSNWPPNLTMPLSAHRLDLSVHLVSAFRPRYFGDI